MSAGPEHLSRIEIGEEPTNLEEGLPDVHLFMVHIEDNQFANIIHFLTIGMVSEGYMSKQKKELVVRAMVFSLIVRHLYKMGVYEILQ